PDVTGVTPPGVLVAVVSGWSAEAYGDFGETAALAGFGSDRDTHRLHRSRARAGTDRGALRRGRGGARRSGGAGLGAGGDRQDAPARRGAPAAAGAERAGARGALPRAVCGRAAVRADRRDRRGGAARARRGSDGRSRS